MKKCVIAITLVFLVPICTNATAQNRRKTKGTIDLTVSDYGYALPVIRYGQKIVFYPPQTYVDGYTVHFLGGYSPCGKDLVSSKSSPISCVVTQKPSGTATVFYTFLQGHDGTQQHDDHQGKNCNQCMVIIVKKGGGPIHRKLPTLLSAHSTLVNPIVLFDTGSNSVTEPAQSSFTWTLTGETPDAWTVTFDNQSTPPCEEGATFAGSGSAASTPTYCTLKSGLKTGDAYPYTATRAGSADSFKAQVVVGK